MKPTAFPAVVTAAGAATRFQPFSLGVPKEMLPLGATPALEHVILECLAAGASEVVVVTRPGDDIVPNYVRGLHDDGLPVDTVAEEVRHGYGNAAPVLTLRDRLSACDRFMVAFGDDVLLGEQLRGADLASMVKRMPDGVEAVIAATSIDKSRTGSFGIIDTYPNQPDRVAGIRQQPDPTTVNEPLAVVSRLLLRPSILDRLAPTDQANGEVDLGIAVAHLAADAPVRVHKIAGHWITVGDPHTYLDALHTYRHLHSFRPDQTGGEHRP